MTEQLTEVGKMFSAQNMAEMGQIHDQQRKCADGLRGLMGKMGTATVESRRRLLLEAAELSFGEREKEIRDAIKSLVGADSAKGLWVYLADVYDTYAVYSVEQDTPNAVANKTYQVSYAVVDGQVTLGAPVEVEKVVSYVPVTTNEAATPPVSEAGEVELLGDLVPLIEKGIGKNGTVPIRIMQPGWGSSGHYSPEVLKRDGPKVFTKGLHMHVDHPTTAEEAERPERSVRTLGGVLETDARWEDNGPAGPGLYAEAKPLGAFKDQLPELAPHIGVSIRALGRATSGEVGGRKGKIIEAITAARSIDFVTTPGAGGQVLQLWEAARGGQAITREEVHLVDEKEAQALREATAQAEAKITTLEGENATLKTELARLKEAGLLREARDVVVEALAKVEMPDLTRARLTEQLAAKPALVDGALDRDAFKATILEAAKSELEYLAGATGSGKIVGMGTSGPAPNGSVLKESFVGLYRRQGHSEAEAKRLAELAAG